MATPIIRGDPPSALSDVAPAASSHDLQDNLHSGPQFAENLNSVPVRRPMELEISEILEFGNPVAAPITRGDPPSALSDVAPAAASSWQLSRLDLGLARPPYLRCAVAYDVIGNGHAEGAVYVLSTNRIPPKPGKQDLRAITRNLPAYRALWSSIFCRKSARQHQSLLPFVAFCA